MTRQPHAHKPAHAHREPSPYAFTLREYALCALAALVASPFLFVFMVVALTALAG